MEETKEKTELNWIFANQYSLLNYLKKEGISNHSLQKIHVNATAFVDSGDLVKSDRISRLTATDTIIVPPVTTGTTKYTFVDGEKTQVSLLYIKTVAFNPYKKKLDIAEVEEQKSKKSTTASIAKNKTILETLANVRDAIEKRVKYFPVTRLFLDQKECPWFVEYKECEYVMRDIALQKYIEFQESEFEEISPIGKARKIRAKS